MVLFIVLLFADKPPKLPTDARKYKPPEYAEPRLKADTPKDISTAIGDFQKRRRDEFQRAIQSVKGNIQLLSQAKRARGKLSRSARQSRLESIREKEQRLREAMERVERIADPKYVPEFFGPERGVKVGWIGRFPRNARILQVLNDHEVIVEANLNGSDETVWLSGTDTAGLTDDKTVELEQPFRLTGTKTYQNALGGSRTVLRAEPFDIEEWLDDEPPD